MRLSINSAHSTLICKTEDLDVKSKFWKLFLDPFVSESSYPPLKLDKFDLEIEQFFENQL